VFELPFSRSIRDVTGMARSVGTLHALFGSDDAPDIVHVHTPIAGFVARLAAATVPRERRPAVIYTAHGFHFHSAGHPITNTLFLGIEKIAGRWTDRLVVINDEDERAARANRLVTRSRLVRMRGIGLDIGGYSRASLPPGASADAREQLHLGPEAPFFVSVGELNRNKRQVDAIAALAAMRHTEAGLVLVGGGGEHDNLERLASDLGVGHRVRFTGEVGDVRPLVAASVALVQPSRREGLSRSIMEALALEVPVIASDARGNGELVGSDAGFIVATGDITGFASRMDWIIDNPAQAREMAAAGRSRAERRYDLQALIRRHEDLYREVLAERVPEPVSS
jgi:glycosyltransferase involved in cell wall biosynthesis